eukprot:Em0004g1011a
MDEPLRWAPSRDIASRFCILHHLWYICNEGISAVVRAAPRQSPPTASNLPVPTNSLTIVPINSSVVPTNSLTTVPINSSVAPTNSLAIVPINSSVVPTNSLAIVPINSSVVPTNSLAIVPINGSVLSPST